MDDGADCEKPEQTDKHLRLY